MGDFRVCNHIVQAASYEIDELARYNDDLLPHVLLKKFQPGLNQGLN